MHDLLFYFFATLTLVFGFLVVANPFTRNPVTSAMFLVLTIGSLAALFILLHAFFLAAVQILVYAGAVMVLFLFVIMLLNITAEARRKFSRFGVATGLIGTAALAALLVRHTGNAQLSVALPAPSLEGATAPLGRLLFQEYVLPFEILSLILLVAMVGVILLSKRQTR